MNRINAVVLLVLSFVVAQAQKAPVKFGKIDESLVKMTEHPLDSSADAVVLMDYGTVKFIYNPNEGFKYSIDRTTRIKILTKEGLDYGNFEIPYYVDSPDKEKVHNLKGITYNMVGNNLKESKLQKSSIFDEESSAHWRQLKVTFPDVEVGSVVEITYELSSPFIWNLSTWEFQNEIPTEYSEFRAEIPEYFDYQLLQSGYHPLKISEKGASAGMITYQSKVRNEGFGAINSQTYNNKVEYQTTTYRWVAQDVPSFELESFVASPSDYILKMEFELKGTNFPGSPYDSYMGTWTSLNKTYVESTSFMKATDHVGFMKDELEVIGALGSETEKIDALVKLIKSNVAWNGSYAKYVESNLRQVWNAKTGSTGEINLMLVGGLRKLGFKADPVLISTRGHGMVREQYAMSKQFNSVIALVQIAEGTILLDATDPYLPSYAIPVKCLNGRGWRVSETSWGFVELNPAAKKESLYQGKFNIDEYGAVTGDITSISKGYSAFSAYKNYKQKGEEGYIETVKSNNPDWELLDYEFDEENGSSASFKSVYNIEMNENLLASADRIYFNPTMEEFLQESPFKLKHRDYPVDFAQPIAETYYFSFSIPDGYVVEEMPESIAFALPDKAGLFKYSITTSGNMISVVAHMAINKVKFISSEYELLRAFYDQAVKKCAEQIVIKRNT